MEKRMRPRISGVAEANGRPGKKGTRNQPRRKPSLVRSRRWDIARKMRFPGRDFRLQISDCRFQDCCVTTSGQLVPRNWSSNLQSAILGTFVFRFTKKKKPR